LRCVEMAIMSLIPGLIIGGWYIWIRNPEPNPGAIAAAGRSALFLWKEPWLRVFLLRSVTLLPITALSAWAAINIRRTRWWLVALWCALIFWLAFNLDLPGEKWIETYEPQFTASFGPLALDFPKQPFTFGHVGNIVRVGGIDFFEYRQESIWTPEA